MIVPDIRFKRIATQDHNDHRLIETWCLEEWQVPPDKTKNRLEQLSAPNFHLMMYLDGAPIATGGIHPRVSLQEKVPGLTDYTHWLAFVYTIPEHRGKGYGAFLCEEIQQQARENGLKELILYTHSAERLYARLGWSVFEKLTVADKSISVMKLKL
jgi:GNAT superfamily N-acetyltransferase